MLALLDRDLTGRHLVHTYTDKSHQSDLGVIRLDEDDSARSKSGDVTLRIRDTLLIDLMRMWVPKALP